MSDRPVRTRRLEVVPPETTGGFPGEGWHDLDLEGLALALWAAPPAGANAAAPEAAWTRLQGLLERDRAVRARDILYGLGAERMLVREESLFRRLLLHAALNRYALWDGQRVRYFSKHPLTGFRGPVPADGLAVLARTQLAGVQPAEIAVFQEERADPILAILVGGEWYALVSWT